MFKDNIYLDMVQEYGVFYDEKYFVMLIIILEVKMIKFTEKYQQEAALLST